MGFKLFLSHRLQDSDVATALTSSFKGWGIPRECIFQAGEPGAGARPGFPLGDQLIEEIRQTDLFLLIFTHLDEDWSYCMWEHGIASGADTKPTNVVVLQCTDHRPRIRQDHMTVDVRKPKEVLDFVTRFHQEADFAIPDETSRKTYGTELTFLKNADSELLLKRSEEMFDGLAKVIPEGSFREKHRLEYIEISVSPALVREVRDIREEARNVKSGGDAKTAAALRADADRLLAQTAVATPKSSEDGLRRFGLEKNDVTLERMFKSWTSDYCEERDLEAAPADETVWWDPLVYDISRAVDGRISRANDASFASIDPNDSARYRVIVAKSREIPDGTVFLDLYLVKLPAFIPVKPRRKPSSTAPKK